VNTLEMLQRLGGAWIVTLTCLTGNDQWQLRIESHPAPRWDESFSYTYRGALTSVVVRAYEGAPDDGPLDPAVAAAAALSPTALTEAAQNALALKDE